MEMLFLAKKLEDNHHLHLEFSFIDSNCKIDDTGLHISHVTSWAAILHLLLPLHDDISSAG